MRALEKHSYGALLTFYQPQCQTEIAGEAGKEAREARSSTEGVRMSENVCAKGWGVKRGVPFPLRRGLGRA